MKDPSDSKSSTSTLTIAVRCLVILTFLAVSYVAMVAKPVLLPLILSLLFTMVVLPVHKLLCRMKLKAPAAAVISILSLATVSITALGSLATPAVTWAQTLDLELAESKLRSLLKPVQEVQEELKEVVEKVDNISADFSTAKPEKEISKPNDTLTGITIEASDVEPHNPNIDNSATAEVDASAAESVTVNVRGGERSSALGYAQSFGGHVGFTFMLVFFFLAYGETLYLRVTEGTTTSSMFEALSEDISSYLLTITIINVGLGITVAAALWLLDMPNPILWGAMATVLNYLPYLGALIGTIIVALVAVLTFSTLSDAALVPAIYYTLTLIEGAVVTPMMIGKRFSLNPIIVVLWFLAWGAVWGIAGMLIATPTLMAFKIYSSKVSGFEKIDRIISR